MNAATTVNHRKHEADLLWYVAIQQAELGRRDEAIAHAQSAIDLMQQAQNRQAAWFADCWGRVSAALATAERKLSCAEIRQRWRESKPPDDMTILRWLTRAVDAGLLHGDGDGVRGSPYRYWLPAREAARAADPRSIFRMPELLNPN